RTAGYEPVQHYYRLRADLAEGPDAPDAPLRTFDGARDEAAVHALVQDAFAEIDGHEFQPLDKWRAKTIGKEGHDPSLWLLLDDDEGLVGAGLGERWEAGTGYVAELAVAARGRGRREWRTDVTNVFDTQVAAGFAGFSAQAGYNGLLHDALRIRLPMTASFTRWDARPLTDEQLRYARGDVEHLLPLADDIHRRLEPRGRPD